MHRDVLIKIDNVVYGYYKGLAQLYAMVCFKKKIDNKKLRNKYLKRDRIQKISFNFKPPKNFFKAIELKEGYNSLVYYFSGNFKSNQLIKARLFFYKFKRHRRVIVSDVDGTITKSDVLGHLMPIFNNQWIH